jgi:hypothetical protein
MQKSIFGKILQNHSLGSWGFYGLILLCPLLHVLMMRGHRMTSDHIKAQAFSADEAITPISSHNLEKDLLSIKNLSSLHD